MFSSPTPAKSRHSGGKQGRSIHTPYREARGSAVSVSSGGNQASSLQHERSNTLFSREHASREEVFSCRPEYKVSARCGAPEELQKIMHSYDAECRGLVDSLTSFALVSLEEETFAWNYALTAGAVHACYIFPNPVSRGGRETPYGCFAPYQNSQQPGLILCSPTGEARFWLSIGLGLTGGEEHQALNLGLSVGEHVNNMMRCEPASFLVSSSWGRLFRLTISSNGGKRQCNAELVFDKKHILSRVASTLFATVTVPAQSVRTISIALEPQPDIGRSIVWAASDRVVQRWAVSANMWDELLFEQHVDVLFTSRLCRDILTETFPASQLQIGLHDIAIASPDTVIALLSYNSKQQTSGNEHLTRAFCLAHVIWDNNALRVANFEQLLHRSDPSESFAKVKLIGDGRDVVAVVHFWNSIIIRSLGREDAFQSILSLKSRWNRVLSVESYCDTSVGSLIIQTLENGLLACQLDVQRIQNSGSETLINRLRATLEQEVFFGANAENPFLFQLEPHSREDVGLAAAQLSGDILSSRLTTALSPDLHIDLAERRSRLLHLVQFITDSGALSTLSELARQRLWLDANRLFVGQELWGYICNPEDKCREDQCMLVRAINNATRKLGEAASEDPVRLFFRTKLQHMDALFDELRILAESVDHECNQLTVKVTAVMECSQMLLTIWGASERHRLASLDIYEMGGAVLVPLWGHDNNHIRVAQYFLEEVVHCLVAASRCDLAFEGINLQSLESRLRDLASMTLSMWDASCDFLASGSTNRELANSELGGFRENFATARSKILGALVDWGGAETAFDLADQYHEYGFLVQLCTHPNLGGAAKTIHYLRKYREAFAFHLYKWYLENGRFTALLEPQPEFLQLVGAFFTTSHYPRLEWIHDLAKPVSNFQSAVTALETTCHTEARVDTKKILLSLTKLASMTSNSVLDESEDGRVGIINNELDLVSVQETLYAEFRDLLGPFSFASADMLGDEILQQCIAEKVARESSFKLVFKHLVKRVLNGSTLNTDEIVTLLSMKDTGTRGNDLKIAVLITLHHMVSNYTLETLWRRCYLADNWVDLKNALSDDKQDQLLQSTHLHSCFSAVRAADSPLNRAILSPRDLLTPPPPTDLSSKHPNLTAAQVVELGAAHERECEVVAHLINGYRLLDWVDKLG